MRSERKSGPDDAKLPPMRLEGQVVAPEHERAVFKARKRYGDIFKSSSRRCKFADNELFVTP